MKTSSFVVAFAIVALGVMTGCGEDVRVDVKHLPGPPGSSFEGDQLRVKSGSAFIVEARAKEGDEPSTAHVDLVAAEPFKILHTTKKHRFVIVADRPGQGTIRIVADGEDVRTVKAEAF
jgi:hypothetical protein